MPSVPRRLGRIPPVVALALVALLLLACGGAERDTPAQDSPAADDATGVEDTPLDDDPSPAEDPSPQRIVSLSASVTEMLFAIGAGDRIVAVDEYSTHPPEAPVTDLSGSQPNVEAIMAFDPDLVVASSDPGELVASLDALDMPSLLLPAVETIDEAYDQIAQLGAASGHEAEATDLVARMQAEIDELLDGLDPPDEPMTYYHELTPDHHSVSSASFIGDAYRQLGLVSIADEVGEAGGAYPQLSPEFIVEADPDLILLADAQCCDVTPEQVAARPGWETMRAVQDDAIVVLDEDVASRWGPRIVDLMRDVAEAIGALERAAG